MCGCDRQGEGESEDEGSVGWGVYGTGGSYQLGMGVRLLGIWV